MITLPRTSPKRASLDLPMEGWRLEVEGDTVTVVDVYGEPIGTYGVARVARIVEAWTHALALASE